MDLDKEEQLMTLLSVLVAALQTAFEEGLDPSVGSISFDMTAEDGSVKLASQPLEGGEPVEMVIPADSIEAKLMEEDTEAAVEE